MYFIEKTSEFDKWLKKLTDLRVKAKVLFRIQKLELEEHFGDFKQVGEGILELRIDFAKGYRVYLMEKDKKIIILLLGGVKSTQKEDIKKAKEIWRRINK
ncbi:MAG: type II toxin-antitoxin system RelE/ParE family toxin [Saprospiraceae bacterium]|nr:type II toxin-antitoxin system RelE/ParE family toxin [Saprospiraceae bacterium]